MHTMNSQQLSTSVLVLSLVLCRFLADVLRKVGCAAHQLAEDVSCFGHLPVFAMHTLHLQFLL